MFFTRATQIWFHCLIFHILNRHRLVKETVDFNDMEVIKDKYSIEFLSRVKQWAFTQAVSPYWRGPSRKSKKKKEENLKKMNQHARGILGVRRTKSGLYVGQYLFILCLTERVI